jgi:high-affinity K+ transport system ATPase subunit B
VRSLGYNSTETTNQEGIQMGNRICENCTEEMAMSKSDLCESCEIGNYLDAQYNGKSRIEQAKELGLVVIPDEAYFAEFGR